MIRQADLLMSLRGAKRAGFTVGNIGAIVGLVIDVLIYLVENTPEAPR